MFHLTTFIRIKHSIGANANKSQIDVMPIFGNFATVVEFREITANEMI